jgi:hypothetical protein
MGFWMRLLRLAVLFCAGLGLFAFWGGCKAPEAPPGRQTLHLKGKAYDRGLQYGQAMSSKIRAYYTQLLTSSLLPYLNREQAGIQAVITEYAKPLYGDGGFSYQLLLQSAYKMQSSIPPDMQDEMQGIADGSGLSYEQVLVLNTFVDTVLAVRGVALALKLAQAPLVESVEFVGTASDGVDNNNDVDGGVDEPGEGLLAPYRGGPRASMVEVPVDVKLRWILADPDGVDVNSLHATLDGQVFEASSSAFSVEDLDPDGGHARIAVTFTPPAPLPEAQVHFFTLIASDMKVVTVPPPVHSNLMREERVTFTTKGYGKKTWEVPNQGLPDGRSQPPSLAFAATGPGAVNGPILAQHFTLLDGNTSHFNTVELVQEPDPSEGQAYVTEGWAGLTYGFSGLNKSGLALACQQADTLDNSVVGSVLNSITDLSKAKLIASGTPMGFVIKQVLAQSHNVDEAVTLIKTFHAPYGWTCLLVDKDNHKRAVEIDSNVDGKILNGVFDYGSDASDPGDVDAHGQLLASNGPNDLRAGTHYMKNTADMFRLTVQGQRVVPESDWSSFYFRSLRTFFSLGESMQAQGPLDVDGAVSILKHKDLIDTSDSMNAVVIEPAALKIHSAMGTVPATDSPFLTLDLGKEVP